MLNVQTIKAIHMAQAASLKAYIINEGWSKC